MDLIFTNHFQLWDFGLLWDLNCTSSNTAHIPCMYISCSVFRNLLSKRWPICFVTVVILNRLGASVSYTFSRLHMAFIDSFSRTVPTWNDPTSYNKHALTVEKQLFCFLETGHRVCSHNVKEDGNSMAERLWDGKAARCLISTELSLHLYSWPLLVKMKLNHCCGIDSFSVSLETAV